MKNKKCFVIAEVSANHNQNFKYAVDCIKKAKECGADAVKFQTYTPDTLTIDVDNKYFTIKHPKWGGQTLYQLYKKAYTPWDWFKKLKKVADDIDLTFFSSAFDKTSVDFLEKLKVPIHKVASFELVDLPLIEYIGRTKKPVILSTGMATVEEIKDAVAAAKKGGAKDITLLKCVSGYPSPPKDMNLNTIPYMKKLFKCEAGLSDHTLGIGTAVAAVSLGAKVIEKHFTLSRKIKSADSFFSLEPAEFKDMVNNIRIAEESLGKIHFGLTDADRKSRVFRRSLFCVQDIKKGERITEDNVRSIRPGHGLAVKHIKSILGKRAKQAIRRGTPFQKKFV